MSLTDPTRTIPTGLATDEFALRPIRASDASRDYTAVMETRVDLRIWEQSSWPEDTFTVDANREDLAGLEQRHEERRAYTYTVIDPADTECLGCVYIFPITATFLTKATVRPVIENAQWGRWMPWSTSGSVSRGSPRAWRIDSCRRYGSGWMGTGSFSTPSS